MSVRTSNLLFIVGLFECFCGWGRSIRFCEDFRFVFPRFCHWWDVKPQGGISFIFRGLPQDDPFFCLFFFNYFFLFACKMVRGYEEVSNSQVWRRRGTPQETPTANSLVVAMSTEELRLYSQVPAEICDYPNPGGPLTVRQLAEY